MFQVKCAVTVLTVLFGLFPLNKSETAVLILARGGSKGVYLKNLQHVGGISLLTRTINIAKSAGFNDVTVSTDHPLIALQALKDNVKILHRSSVTATDWAPSIWGAAEFLTFRPDVTILILMQATSPFTRPIHLRNAMEQINHPEPYDCIFSATRSYKLRWVRNKSKLYPINFDINVRIRRQDWDGELLETGAFYITRRWLLLNGKFQNDNCTVYEVSELESLEVDTVDDLRLANILLSANLV